MFPLSLPYILQPEDQLFFLHIPKTAGTTLISLLDQHFPPEEIFPEQLSSRINSIPLEKLPQYRLFRGHLDYDFTRLLPKKPLIITMLRDPVERVVSLYEFWKRNVEVWVAQHPAEHEDNFREAIQKDLYSFVYDDRDDFIRLEVQNGQTRRIISNVDDKLAGLNENEILNIAKKRLEEEFLFFGLLEKFDESLDLLCYSLAWHPIRHYERQNVAPSQIKNNQIPSETRHAILERNQVDSAFYEFAAGLFSERYHGMVQDLVEKNSRKPGGEWNPISGDIIFNFVQDFQGQGWYPPEETPDGTSFRWSGPQNESYLDLILPLNQDLKIKIYILSFISPDILNQLTLFVNERQIYCSSFPQDGFAIVFQGVIPQNVLELNPYLTRIKFRVNRTVSPQQLNESPDVRQLALAYHKIAFHNIN